MPVEGKQEHAAMYRVGMMEPLPIGDPPLFIRIRVDSDTLIRLEEIATEFKYPSVIDYVSDHLSSLHFIDEHSEDTLMDSSRDEETTIDESDAETALCQVGQSFQYIRVPVDNDTLRRLDEIAREFCWPSITEYVAGHVARLELTDGDSEDNYSVGPGWRKTDIDVFSSEMESSTVGDRLQYIAVRVECDRLRHLERIAKELCWPSVTDFLSRFLSSLRLTGDSCDHFIESNPWEETLADESSSEMKLLTSGGGTQYIRVPLDYDTHRRLEEMATEYFWPHVLDYLSHHLATLELDKVARKVRFPDTLLYGTTM
jgi:hypothetical protein